MVKVIVLTQRVFNEICYHRRLKQDTEAYLLGAKALGLDDLVETFEKMKRIYEIQGYMTMQDSDERFAALSKMMEYARSVLDDKTYDEFYNLF